MIGVKSATLALPLAILLLCGCAQPVADPADLLQAYKAAEQGDWAKAKPLISEYLYFAPDDPGGHMLLGQYYLSLATPYVTPAEGEFRLARTLMEKPGHADALNAVLNAEKMAITLHMGISRAKLALARMLQKQGVPSDGVLAQVNLAFEEALAGKRAHPESVEMIAFFERVKAIAHRYREDRTVIIEAL